MIRTIYILLLNDLALAFKNKTVLLLIFVPSFVSLSMKLIDGSDGSFQKPRVGIVEDSSLSPAHKAGFAAADALFSVEWVESMDKAIEGLKEKSLDGVIYGSRTKKSRLELLVYRRESLSTVAILENISALQGAIEHRENWVETVHALSNEGVQKDSMPTWILMIALLVGFIQIPTQVAEEKEKKLLLGLLQTPIRESEWLFSKLLHGVLLSYASVLLLHALSGISLGHWLGYLIFLGLGFLFFSAAGIFLGFLCRTQASARAIGAVIYMPLLLPSALSDYSQEMGDIAQFFPSYYFFEPMKALLLQEIGLRQFWPESVALMLGAVLFFSASSVLVRKRWQM